MRHLHLERMQEVSEVALNFLKQIHCLDSYLHRYLNSSSYAVSTMGTGVASVPENLNSYYGQSC